MSQRKRKATNKPSHSNPLSAPAAPSSLELTAFHPSKPLYAVASTAIGRNVVRLFDVDRPVPGAQEARSEIRLKKNEHVSCLSWAGFDEKGQKRSSSKTELVVGLSNGRIFVIDEALGEIVRTFEGHTAAVRGWTTDGSKGWTCGNDAKLRLWDLQTDTCLQTVSPELEGAEFSSLTVSKDYLFCSAAETLYQLSKSDGKILTQVVPHMMPIHSVQYLPELDLVVTAAIGDRFINIFSSNGTSLNRLGSLTCTHDVRTFAIKKSTLLVVTTIGTLEVFPSFHSNFEPGKKRGMTKPADASINLTTSQHADVRIQNVTASRKKVIISWVEGAKLGFESIDISSMTGKVEINVETRQEQTQEQISKPYDEANAVVSVGRSDTQDGIHDTDHSFEHRLSQLTSKPLNKETQSPQAVIPGTSSLAVILTQALNSADEKLLQSCFSRTHDQETIHSTLVRLPPALVPSLLNYFNSVLSHKQKRARVAFDWIREAVVVHGAFLVSQGADVREVLVRLKGTLDRRGQSWERLTRLKGRLEMLRSIRNQQRIGGDRKPEVTWQEAREEEEEEIEDVRYLLGNGVNEASDDDMAESEDEDEIVGLDDTKIMNGIEEENSSDESIDVPTKVNGISHDSDSDDAVDLDDLIDDEAEETSDDDDEEEEGEEEEEDDDDENSDVPRPKKPKLR